jgi:hypothetical protein
VSPVSPSSLRVGADIDNRAVFFNIPF